MLSVTVRAVPSPKQNVLSHEEQANTTDIFSFFPSHTFIKGDGTKKIKKKINIRPLPYRKFIQTRTFQHA